MNTNTRRVTLAAAILLAIAAGFGLAQVTASSSDSQAAGNASVDDSHASHGDQPSPDAHSDQEGREAGSESHGSEEEGAVALTKEQIEASGITVVPVGRGGGGETRLSGRVESTIGARAAVAATIGGRVERVVVSPGSTVRAGDTLAILVSGEAASLRAAADAARAEAEAARLVFNRDQSLVTQGVVAQQELESSRARSLAFSAQARAAVAQANAAGAPDAAGRITITSPVSGVVGAVQVTPGGFVNAGEIIANVADPSQTEIVFVAPPLLASQVSQGTRIEVSGPAGTFSALVTGAAADVGEQGGLAIIRARAESGSLPPTGSPVAGSIVVEGESQMLTVPADSVQTVDGSSVVFVAGDDGFHATQVLAGRRAGGRIEILKGLTGDERVAGTNAFLLKAELAKGEAEHGH
ncbi:efflux RND transporter periplasmic adaptor subunit [Luteimonas sp. WGS1318]|uniref:efflux RND transporter periplasmic adaptor subunit n=1 Tax=Luteimonas sp. WGS1318 TaxID=3366815 RepID=UPI00372D5980